MLNILFVGLGGFFGAAGRYMVSLAMQGRAGAFPAGTLLANLVGCFVIGWIAHVVLHGEFHPGVRLFFVVGVLGGFTTFSSFSLESLGLMESGRWNLVSLYISVSVIGGIALTFLGAGAARWILGKG